jgi:hypothetical protein
LLKLYLSEANSPQVAAWAHTLTQPLPLTPLLELELVNAVELRRHRREITAATAQHVLALVDADIANGVLQRTPLDLATWRKAVDLAREHTAAAGCRSLDILHVAAALALEADPFYTFDQRQRDLARRVGLHVQPALE